jgi:hypothetical protein
VKQIGVWGCLVPPWIAYNAACSGAMALYYLWNLAFLKVSGKGKQGARAPSKARRD